MISTKRAPRPLDHNEASQGSFASCAPFVVSFIVLPPPRAALPDSTSLLSYAANSPCGSGSLAPPWIKCVVEVKVNVQFPYPPADKQTPIRSLDKCGPRVRYEGTPFTCSVRALPFQWCIVRATFWQLPSRALYTLRIADRQHQFVAALLQWR